MYCARIWLPDLGLPLGSGPRVFGVRLKHEVKVGESVWGFVFSPPDSEVNIVDGMGAASFSGRFSIVKLL